jgi:hypothetical protein
MQVRMVSVYISDHPKVKTYTEGRGAQIFKKSRSHLKMLGVRRLT